MANVVERQFTLLVQCDASALEIRVAAFLSQDPVLIKEIIDGLDLHTDNQQKFGLPSRLIAKILNFRILYGGNEFSFANDPDFTEVSKSKAYWKDVVDAYYDKYRGIKEWHTKIIREVVQTGKLISPTGREYHFQKYNGEYKDTQIKNYSVQGTGADLMALARVSFYNRLKKLGLKDCLLVNTVHDSIVVDCIPEHLEVVGKLCHEVFRDLPANFEKLFGVKYNVPMECETLYGNDWENMRIFERDA
jgi:DNA polymerase I-like protein with 3'-5' exonuclease and polymerase domains